MVIIKDINYVSYLSVVKNIDFDTYKKYIVGDGNRFVTAFIYNDMTSDEYHRAIADFHKSEISKFVNKLKNMKTIVHDNGAGGEPIGKEDTSC